MQTSLDRTIEERLGDTGVRYTAARKAVVNALSAADGPRSAAELHRDIDSVPLSSIYRTLTVLEDAKVLAPHHGARGLTRYELAEWLRGHHHHLVCTNCGTVEDVDVSVGHEARIDEVIAAISASASFTPTDHALEIEGLCVGCA